MAQSRGSSNDPVHPPSSSHSLTSAFSPPESRMGVKVAIPRISTSGPAMQRRRRAPRACEQCRQRKIKCTAETPSCRQCLDLNLHCAYSEGKRVREQRQLESLTRKVEQYERFMREISEEVDDHVARRIRRVLKVGKP